MKQIYRIIYKPCTFHFGSKNEMKDRLIHFNHDSTMSRDSD